MDEYDDMYDADDGDLLEEDNSEETPQWKPQEYHLAERTVPPYIGERVAELDQLYTSICAEIVDRCSKASTIQGEE